VYFYTYLAQIFHFLKPGRPRDTNQKSVMSSEQNTTPDLTTGGCNSVFMFGWLCMHNSTIKYTA